jgi:hypothetical protein
LLFREFSMLTNFSRSPAPRARGTIIAHDSVVLIFAHDNRVLIPKVVGRHH